MLFAGKRATTNTNNRSHNQKKSCSDIPSEGSRQREEAVKGNSIANDDGGGCGDSSSETSRMKLNFFKPNKKLEVFGSRSSPRQKKCTNTLSKIPVARDLETQNNDHSQRNKKGSENEIVRDKREQVSEAMQSIVNIQRAQDSTSAKPCSISNSALDTQSRVRDEQITGDSPTYNTDELKRLDSSEKSRRMDTSDTHSSSYSKTFCPKLSKEEIGTDTSSACTSPDRGISALLNTIESLNLKSPQKGSSSDSALIEVENFIDSNDNDRVQTDVGVKRKSIDGHSESKRGSKSSAVETQHTQKVPEMMTHPMGRLRKRKVKKKN